MLCEMHKAPAVFFSEKEDRYVCFKCLVKSEKLLYIDKSFQTEMEDFERIKTLCSEAVTSNIKNTSIIKQWKYEIRASLMKIKVDFNDNLDKFIEKFAKVFKNIESSSELIEYQGEDKRL